MTLLHKPTPKIIKPFDQTILSELAKHVTEIRRCFDWPGIPYHDAAQPDNNRFNRWFWHELPLLRSLHHSRDFVNLVSHHFKVGLKPSYSFLSMYGPEGVCPIHSDRPQCQYTVDLCVRSDGSWKIYIEDEPFWSIPGEALAYSGTGQIHYRKPMKEDSLKFSDTTVPATFMDLAFFHFVPTDWQGPTS